MYNVLFCLIARVWKGSKVREVKSVAAYGTHKLKGWIE